MTPHARIAFYNAFALIAVYTFFYSVLWKFLGSNGILLLIGTLVLIVGIVSFGQKYLSQRTRTLVDSTYDERVQFWWTLLGALTVVILVYVGTSLLQGIVSTLEYDVARIVSAAIMVAVGAVLLFQLKPVAVQKPHKKSKK